MYAALLRFRADRPSKNAGPYRCPFLGHARRLRCFPLGPETVSSVRLDGGGRYKPPSTTASVASLLSDSALPASSVKVTRNLMVLPTSPEATT